MAIPMIRMVLLLASSFLVSCRSVEERQGARVCTALCSQGYEVSCRPNVRRQGAYVRCTHSRRQIPDRRHGWRDARFWMSEEEMDQAINPPEGD